MLGGNIGFDTSGRKRVQDDDGDGDAGGRTG